jgi:hypothetical protein
MPDSPATRSPDPNAASREGGGKRRAPRKAKSRRPPVLPLSSGEALRTLREHVEEAAEALRELRAENARLRARVLELEERLPEGDVAVVEGQTPEALRQQIDHFIALLDQHLEGDAGDSDARGTASEAAS